MRTTRTPLFSRKQPGGVFVIDDLAEHPGDLYFVDSGASAASDSAGFGKNPDAPFATLDYAVGKTTADQGDTIYVMPGHAESLTGAGDVTVDVDGINIVGLGRGANAPTFTAATSAAASVVVSSDDVYVKNLRFVCNIANQNHAIDLSGDNFTIEGCEFLDGTASGLAAITADTADGDSDYCAILGCLFYSPGGNGDAAIQMGKDFTNWLIEDNDIYGDYDEAGIDVASGADASALLRIYKNRITQLQADDHAIQISGTAVTGWAIGNKMQTNAQATVFDASALSCHDNTWLDPDGSNDEEAVPANTMHATSTMVVALQTGAVSATAIAADAITNAKIADAAMAYEQYDLDAPVVKTVKSADFALDGGSVADVFTIANGPIELLGLLTFLTEAVSAHACAVKWQLDPTTGAASNDLCATFDINAAAIGDCLNITGVHDGAMLPGANGTECGLYCATSVFLPPGGIDFDAANNTPTSGIADVYLIYRPLGAGVTVVAA